MRVSECCDLQRVAKYIGAQSGSRPWYSPGVFDDLDALDEVLLAHFGTRFPKPTSIDFCDYDVAPEDAARLCTDPRLYANEGLIGTFVRHNRYGMLGDWRDFPAFVGDLAVFCRRQPMMLDGDHGFFFLHLAEGGAFDDEDRALLRRWVEDILMPWKRSIERSTMHVFGVYKYEQDWSYLGLLIELGGDVNEVLARNLERSRFTEVTKLARALSQGDAREAEFREHFKSLLLADNQTPPTKRFVRRTLATEVWRAVRTFRAGIPVAPQEPIDVEALCDDLCDDRDPARVEHALLTLEGACWHSEESLWKNTLSFPHTGFDPFDVVPVRLVEAYLAITQDYSRCSDDCEESELRWAQGQAVFEEGDGRAAAALAACVLGDEYPRAGEVLSCMWDALGEADHPCRSTRVEGARLLMRRLLLSTESIRRECIAKMQLWSGDLRSEVAQPLLELLTADERSRLEAEWAESDENE